MDRDRPTQPSGPSTVSAGKSIALCTLASRVTGLIRDMLLLHTFGQGWVADAFNFAFQFPNLFRRLFGEGALAAVFVPTFTATLETEGRPSAWRLLARTLALLVVTLTALVLILELLIVALWWIAPGGAPDETTSRRLLLGLTALMLPFMLSICVLALFASILNCLGSFVPAALAPIALNVLMIAGIVVLGPAIGGGEPDVQVYGVAISVVIAGVVQLLVVLPALRLRGVRLGWEFAPRDPQVRRILTLMGPVLLGQGVLLLSAFFDTILCTVLSAKYGWLGDGFPYPLEAGALTAVASASRLYQFPLGVLVISLATAALPAFSRFVARQEWSSWTDEVRTMLRLAVFEGLLAGAMMIVLAVPIVRLLFEYRSFAAADTDRAAHVLAWYGAGMWAFCAQHIVLRAFYSLGDVRTPLRIAAWFVPVNLAISLALVWLPSVREAAFAISSSLTSALSVLVGIRVLQTRTPTRVADAGLVRGIAIMLSAAIATGLTVAVARPAWMQWLASGAAVDWLGASTGTVVVRALDAIGGLGLGILVYLALAHALRLPEVALLLARRTSAGGRVPEPRDDQ